ncbi:MAG: hypothetical protein COW01_07890 [Bdellovibrionales bacterium CG12_big_fil_rev_8_21_14_0_65_38_15]|nr:MAG: hypothetical protein COW79_10900 [Bdellovibrionales bacterium CG22_combo_CG10-13_8_21_14_all_38_13]PIQ55291.1 MAG: hypothetical protein COW01_07890 [Bdellovibrionales bacterium CG12_big_fil_rev_8_21_14_0_65_38_15]PIR30795.1 MAG: hypothetical protein COV38_03695 [Bdellovibrionales bacterium CG11_big_fil_rev_8_21_14_0_20_38_13]
MAKRKQHKKIYIYSCPITEEKYKLTREVKNEEDLMSVKAYYDMHAEEDDRPEHIKKKLLEG